MINTSHPASPAYPSAADLSMAYYPEAVYAIISLMQRDNPVLRAFCMADKQISEVTFKVIPPEAAGGQLPNPLT